MNNILDIVSYDLKVAKETQQQSHTGEVCFLCSVFKKGNKIMKNKNMTHWNERRMTQVLVVAVALMFGGVSAPLMAQTRLSSAGPQGIIPEPFFHHSFVRDGVNVPRQIVARDFEYSADIAAQIAIGTNYFTNFTEVDIVMQQCFGGGSLDDIQRDVPGPHTFSSSTLWSEVSFIYPHVSPTIYYDAYTR